MRTMNRSTLILVLVAVVGMSLAAAVAARTGGGATAMGTYSAGSAQQSGLADTSATTTTAATGAPAIDPAKEQPILDKFHSRDPFIQVTPTPGTGGPGPGPSSSPSASPSPVLIGANVKISGGVSGSFKSQKVGAVLLKRFKITAITSGGVAFKLVNGWQVTPSGVTKITVASSSSFDLKKGTTATETDTIKITLVFKSSGGGGGGGGGSGGGTGGGSGGSLSGQSIQVLSIDTQNGTASATLEVGGVTYAAKKIGSVFSTSAGQIKILGINTAAQTVTVLQGDQQLTLHVGESSGK